MASKGNKKENYEANEIFLQYIEEIVNNEAYEGMPDLRHVDGSIQWEAPSNRMSGDFKDSHDKRLAWWKRKAVSIGINTNENHWISKTAKAIHPTGEKPCKRCGRIMEIRYCYLSVNFIRRVYKYTSIANNLQIDETTHVLDFLPMFIDALGTSAYDILPKLFSCAQYESIPDLPHTLEAWSDWIDKEYIPREPTMLGPGAMSNAPDRLDGFHSFNRCCRASADKGRTKENLLSYSTDRRAFENWVEGNWITANKLMSSFSANPAIRMQYCVNNGDGRVHPRPCSADHIGPLSLGFCHFPEFQLLCSSCNSAKNNRMYLSDVQYLIKREMEGQKVATWYAEAIWNLCKERVQDQESALKLSRIMRDNRNVAMILLYSLFRNNELLFLYSFLNLQYADFEYAILTDTIQVNNHIITAQFERHVSSLKYVTNQKVRKVRVAFFSLIEYAEKENRNGYMFSNQATKVLWREALKTLDSVNSEYKELNNELKLALISESETHSKLSEFVEKTSYSEIQEIPAFVTAKEHLKKIMQIVAIELNNHWDDSRYSRTDYDEQ